MWIDFSRKSFQLSLLTLIFMILTALSGASKSLAACDDSAGICQGYYNTCVDGYNSCVTYCNGDSYCYSSRCAGLADYNVYGNIVPTGCLAQKLGCLQQCGHQYKYIIPTGGGSISPPYNDITGYYDIFLGQCKAFNINPDWCYGTVSVLLDGVSEGSPPPSSLYYCNTNNATERHILTANFALKSYTVTPNAGPGGSLSPSVPQTVNCGLTKSFTVTPNNCYSISSVGGCSGALSGSTYKTSGVTGDCTVTANFAINQYTITAMAGSGGSITPSATVNCGSSPTFYITADSGYLILDIKVNNNSLANVKGVSSYSYTFSNVNANNTISATFYIPAEACPNFPVRIAGSPQPFTDLQSAYDAAASGDVILSLGTDLIGDLNANLPISVTIVGGYDCNYAMWVGDTNLKGAITVSAGSLIIGGITEQQ